MSAAASALPAVFITVPKYVTITPSPSPPTFAATTTMTTLPKLRPAPAAHSLASSPSSIASSSDGDDSRPSGVTPRGKKRRLDHLSWEEKVQRKKLKNRVAAQTSRDRKKARMEEMEGEIGDLLQRTELLQNKCESLQAINDSLLEKNHKLDMEVELLRQQLTEMQEQQQQQQQQQQQSTQSHTCLGCETTLAEHTFHGSAVSSRTDPLQQGSTQASRRSSNNSCGSQPTKVDSQSRRETTTETTTPTPTAQLELQLKRSSSLATLWRIVALCLLYRTCSSSTSSCSAAAARRRPTKTTTSSVNSALRPSMPADWRSWPKASWPISPQTWRLALQRAQRMLPKLAAVQSDCLDEWWGPQQSAWNPADMAAALCGAKEGAAPLPAKTPQRVAA